MATKTPAAGPDRPRVHLNCACSLDGKLSSPDGTPMPLSDEMDWRRVHGLRAASDALLVGVGTILLDDPSLHVKSDLVPVSPTRKLLRVILDSKGRTPVGARAVDASAPSLVLTGPGVRPRWPKAETRAVKVDEEGRIDLGAALQALRVRGVERLLVEGGAQVLRSFLNTEFVDTWTLYQAPVLIGGHGPSIFDGRPSAIGRRIHVENVEARGKGVLWTLRP
ncbi:MAG: RibD family protein [Thermoplasmatota archaeon]